MNNSGKIFASATTLVIALLIGFAPSGADAQRGGGSPPPPTIETASVLCAQTGNNILRYAPDGNCPPHHQPVAFADGPVTACVSTLTGVMRLTGPGLADCQAREFSVSLPSEEVSVACANPYTNVLAYAENPSDCQPRYTIVQFIPGPTAIDDSYLGDDATAGNTLLTVDAANGVLANDLSARPSMTVVSHQASAANGGEVVVNPDGSFTYNPPVGFNGTDTFSYTAEDAAGQQAPAEVTVLVDGMVWYVDNSQATNGDGRLTSPFNTMVEVDFHPEDPDEEGDFIYVFEGSGPYTNINLENGQTLAGQGVDFILFEDVIVPAANAPTIQGDPAIRLAEGNEISGVTAASTSGPATVIGANLDAPTYIRDVTFHPPTGGGYALDLIDAGAVISVANSTFEGAGAGAGAGVRIFSGPEDGENAGVLIDNVTFESLETGIEANITNDSEGTINTTVVYSQFLNISGRGIWAQGNGDNEAVMDLEVYNSTFDNTALASNDKPAIRIVSEDESEQTFDIDITGNIITGVPSFAPEGRGAIDIGILGDTFASILITDNTITGGSSTGIDVRGTATIAGEPGLYVGIFENTIDAPGTAIALRSLNEDEENSVSFLANIADNHEISGGEYGIWARAEGDGTGTGRMTLTIEDNTINGQVRMLSRNEQNLATALFGNTIVSTSDAINFRSWGISSFCSTILGNTLTSGDGSADISLRAWEGSDMWLYDLTNLSPANNNASVDANARVDTTVGQCGVVGP